MTEKREGKGRKTDKKAGNEKEGMGGIKGYALVNPQVKRKERKKKANGKCQQKIGGES